MKRRHFLAATSAAVILPHLAFGDAPKRKVAVIGHTGRGNYGHGLDTVWQEIPATEIVAVADANSAGLEKAKAKLKLERGYADYRQMLSDVRPEFVAVAPRYVDEHRDMILAAIDAGAKGIYCEKAFCRTPAEADEIIAAADKQGVKIAVAHRNRYHPALPQIKALIASGELGKLIEMRGRGVGDRRGGGEDLWVLGTHIFNLVDYFAGAPRSCSAIMLQDGRPVTSADVREGAEGLGPLAGNELHARYETEQGIVAYYDTVADDGTDRQAYCLQLIGGKGMVTIFIDRNPIAYFSPGNPYQTTEPRQWLPITSAGVGKPEPNPEACKEVANHVLGVKDLIDAVDNNRQPLCSATDARTAVEMVCAAFASHVADGKRVNFPLQERGNALASWK
ncbi:Gfo/Idh/MocA family oxidoreductase [Blastopirellula sp. JC732]|uniref:Gfo/Idh/MocA family oxidoreductase n=1 Tax=Blastopirellula sediminis TaxID=2894196 RepID=A0A9X1SHK3_9BACT|nr:Gfo/Idh/MocA family oxidoreductase [Blastopirellula sediminis]MCC9606782.1 Gfo/Idh/MocA family oxidoreductase [Blastopirellula sediminis]MCC9629921.1 Gfo/Idh/MocA family oxidoreductase [Blastopirellula sediminis]